MADTHRAVVVFLNFTLYSKEAKHKDGRVKFHQSSKMLCARDTTGVCPFMILFVLIKAAGEGGGWESRPVQRTYSICLVCLQVQTFLSHCPPCYASPSNSNPQSRI